MRLAMILAIVLVPLILIGMLLLTSGIEGRYLSQGPLGPDSPPAGPERGPEEERHPG